MSKRLVEHGKINASSFLEVTSELADFIMQEKYGDKYENFIFRDEAGSYNYTEEGQTEGLGIFDVDVLKFDSTLVKVPQIGWNTITNLKSELFQQVSEHSFMYLVHSYYAPISTETISTSEYQIQYSSALQKDNFYGVQFHPEKSSNDGEQLLKNFLNL